MIGIMDVNGSMNAVSTAGQLHLADGEFPIQPLAWLGAWPAELALREQAEWRFIDGQRCLIFPLDIPLLRLQFPRGSFAGLVWAPIRTTIVLGAAGQPTRDVFLEQAVNDGLLLVQRRGGGGTVLLAPGMLCCSFAADVRDPFGNRRYFREINQAMIAGFAAAGVSELQQSGLSDLAARGRKIAGSSIYRSRQRLIYHSVALVNPDLELISRYLAHPPREPDYRAGRTHRDFLAALVPRQPNASPRSLAAGMASAVTDGLRRMLLDDWTPADRNTVA